MRRQFMDILDWLWNNIVNYLRPTFTLPASNRATEKEWDLSILTKAEFKKKYKISEEQYKKLVG